MNDGTLGFESQALAGGNEAIGSLALHEGDGKRMMTGNGKSKDGKNSFTIEWYPAR